METYLIVVESVGVDSTTYHYQPYRTASSPAEVRELIQDYYRVGPETDALIPDFFAVYREENGKFGLAEYYSTMSSQPIDATEWLQQAGRL
jgi:hypothetical protein